MKYLLLELRPWMIDIDDEVYKMLQEIPEVDEFGQHNEYFKKTKRQVKDEINARMRIAYSLVVSGNVLPHENYILYADGKPVGIGGLRFKVDEYWLRHGGNIWYKTRPSQRLKGHATMLAKMLCERAKALGMTEILAQCSKQNIGSNKVLLNNGFKKYMNTTHTNFYKKKV